MGAQPVPGDKTDKVSCVQQKQNWPQDRALGYAVTQHSGSLCCVTACDCV